MKKGSNKSVFGETVKTEQLEPLIKVSKIFKNRTTQSGDTSWDEITPPVEMAEMIEIAHGNAWHGRCIELKSKSISYSYEIDEKEKEILQEWFSDDYDTLEEAFQQKALDFQLTGNIFEEIERKGRTIRRVYRIEPETMIIKKNGSFLQRTDRDIILPPYNPDQLGENQCYHYRNINSLSKFYGYPTWIFSLEALRLDRNIKIFFASFFENGAIPDLIIALEGADFSPALKKELRAVMQQTKGVRNSHKTILLGLPFPEAKIKVDTVTSPIKDMDFGKIGDPCRDEIIASHGVPPRLLGIIPAGHMGGMGDGDNQIEMFYRFVVGPDQKFLGEKINRLLRDSGHKGTLTFTNPYESAQETKWR